MGVPPSTCDDLAIGMHLARQVAAGIPLGGVDVAAFVVDGPLAAQLVVVDGARGAVAGLVTVARVGPLFGDDLVVAVVGVLGLVLQRIEGLEKFDAMIKTTLRESPNKPSVMRESPQHLIRAAHEPDELFRL